MAWAGQLATWASTGTVKHGHAHGGRRVLRNEPPAVRTAVMTTDPGEVVLDTNVFVAAGFNPGSHSARLVEAVRDGRLGMAGWAWKCRPFLSFSGATAGPVCEPAARRGKRRLVVDKHSQFGDYGCSPFTVRKLAGLGTAWCRCARRLNQWRLGNV